MSSERFLRVYKKFNFNDIKNHVLLYGALAGFCSACKATDVKLDSRKCPSCGTDFHYIAFQNIRDHLPKMLKLCTENPDMFFLDYDDFKKTEGEMRAKDILG